MDRPITKYVILKSMYVTELERQVETYIEDGWQPFGSLVCEYDAPDINVWAQAMVKYGY